MDKFKWERIEEHDGSTLWRGRVIDGWLVKSYDYDDENRESTALVFIPDVKNTWSVRKV